MESGPEKRKEPREITYQVGWKKGKIAYQEESVREDSKEDKQLDQSHAQAAHIRLLTLWKAAPSLPEGMLLPLLYGLPLVLFIATLILVYELRGPS
ncbi:hypothetical protein [Paenibacillus hexagrammi]|uniref:Uncharacterized protein n=1 Tax=Paenibacillus hexagrammi TaxID=2908839 RepID=A0ABY3SCK9_9BACL|nr:hypothetical protein [Paenibacillus sp. YPD9-1]UJF31532.1 hypothetical protein L0M14_17140 [Paenibacillus sp. YPD9-1]